MIVSVSIEDKDVVLKDNNSGVVKLSSDLSTDSFESAINKLDFAYGLKRWAEKYYHCLKGGFKL